MCQGNSFQTYTSTPIVLLKYWKLFPDSPINFKKTLILKFLHLLRNLSFVKRFIGKGPSLNYVIRSRGVNRGFVAKILYCKLLFELFESFFKTFFVCCDKFESKTLWRNLRMTPLRDLRKNLWTSNFTFFQI